MFLLFFEKEILSGHEFLHFDTVVDAHATSKHTRVVLSFKKSNCSTHVSYNSPDFHVSIVFCFNGHFALLVPDFREARNLSELWTLNLYKFLIFCRNNLVKAYPPDFFYFYFFFIHIFSKFNAEHALSCSMIMSNPTLFDWNAYILFKIRIFLEPGREDLDILHAFRIGWRLVYGFMNGLVYIEFV